MMLLADTEGYFAAALIGAVATAFVAVLKEYLPWKLKKKEMEAKDRKDAYESALEECNKTIGRLEQQADRSEQAIHEQQRVVNQLARENGDCREEGVEFRGVIFFLHSIVKQQHDSLARAGIPVEDIPDLPKFREHREEQRQVEFQQKTTAQNAALIAEAGKQIKEQTSALPDPPCSEGLGP